jgi:hypothetical protein
MTDKEVIKMLLDTLYETVDWVEANVAYGLSKELLEKTDTAIELGKKQIGEEL